MDEDGAVDKKLNNFDLVILLRALSNLRCVTLLFPTHRPCIYVVDALSLAHHYSLTFVNNISLVSEAAMPMMMLVASTRRSKGCLEPAHRGVSLGFGVCDNPKRWLLSPFPPGNGKTS